MAASNAREHGESVEAWHDEIKKDPIDDRGLEDTKTFAPIESHQHVMSLEAQRVCDHLGDRRIVLDHKYSHEQLRGRSIRAGASLVKE
jgi:hypothetical protein